MPHLTSRAPHPAPSTSSTPRVVVTGIGLATCLGMRREDTWRNLRAGRQGFRVLDLPVANGALPYVGCPLPQEDRRPLEPLRQAMSEAYADARLSDCSFDRDRAAVVVGMSKGDLRRLAKLHRELLEKTSHQPGLAHWTWGWPDAGARLLASEWDLRGPCLAPIAACATGLVAALQAVDLIRRGVCDVAVAGAGDSSLEPLVLAAFRRMGVLARADGDPRRAVRPWDRDRSGFLVGEGAAVLVLERADHAEKRGALPYVEFSGGAHGADAFHETNLNPDPTGLAALIGRALELAGVNTSEIDHVNVHGTATRANDPLECRALRLALGESADRVACSANKAQIGHLLGAAGAAELAITCLAVRDGFAPPTVNLDHPDPGCDLDGTAHAGRDLPIRAALKLSIGFGGHMAAAVLRRPDHSRREPPGVVDSRSASSHSSS